MRMKWLWGVAAVAVAGVGFVWYSQNNGGVHAEVIQVSRGEIRQVLEETAQVLSKEKQVVYVDGSGKVTQIGVDVGDVVKQGDILLSLDKTDLELQLRDAQAKIEASRAQLKGTELDNYANKIELAKVAVDQARITYESAQRSFENVKKLYEAKALSKEEFDKAQDAYKSAGVALDTANLQLEDVKQGAPEYLKNSYKAQLEQSIVYKDTILRNLQKQEVRAAMDGVILERLVDRGSPVAPGTPVFVVGNINNLELEADILADDVGKIKIGNGVEISGKALGDHQLKGRIAKIAPAAKAVTSTLGVNQKRVPVKIEISGETSMLKPGYNLDVKIITTVKKDTIKVPDSAVFDYQGRNQVFVLENGKARLREIKKGIESEKDIEILEGLKDGDILLIKPDNSIREGIIVKQPGQKNGESGKSVQ